MLEPLEIMSGFKYIRTEFRTNQRIEKPLSELALWFTFVNDLLYVHDFEKHKTMMKIAILLKEKENLWKIWLQADSPGDLLIKEALDVNRTAPQIYLNNQYQLRGFVPAKYLK